MDEDQGNDGFLDMGKADKSVWLMKCPIVVAKSWEKQASSSDSQPVAKVVFSLDPLKPDEPQFTMEMVGSETERIPKSYTLNMFKDFVPMCVFSETSQGAVAMEGRLSINLT
ncbi:cysteine proteinase 15A-like [Hibiscus syriacus]|uniref:Cysteine proteinase 15A-like n=1 Tax=Hibiscus syriacus TaxID=106335 RepID=A0A6A3B1Z0_HIBSY|nr:cysteine proteinase 15A-like [Hibiscus syriacus]